MGIEAYERILFELNTRFFTFLQVDWSIFYKALASNGREQVPADKRRH